MSKLGKSKFKSPLGNLSILEELQFIAFKNKDIRTMAVIANNFIFPLFKKFAQNWNEQKSSDQQNKYKKKWKT